MHSTRHELQKAVASGDAANVERLLEFGGPELAAAYTDDGWTLLHLAPTAEIAQLLLAHGADINAPNRHRVFGPGNSPLHAATYMGSAEVARLLIQKGGNVNATDNAVWTPLHLAASNGYVDIARRLLEAGADPNARTGDVGGAQWANKTPLELMTVNNRVRDDGTRVDSEADAAVATLLREHGGR